MDPQESKQDKVSRVARQVSGALRKQARRQWDTVKTAERNERGRHVWRFQAGADQPERFLHVTHDALADGDNAAPLLLQQLKTGRWLDRLQEGPETSLLLSRGGRLEAWPKN
jgi:hypothetical protein